MSQRKFQAMIFYQNQDVLDWYLRSFQFDEPIKSQKRQHELYFEYEHFEIRCYQRLPNESFRGNKCDFIAVENILTEDIKWSEYKNTIIPLMLEMQKFPVKVQIFE